MKATIKDFEFVNCFRAIRPTQFSTDALRTLFQHLEEVERDCGEEVELDVIGICCDWTEYRSAIEAAEAYRWKNETEEVEERDSKAEEDALEWLRDQTQVLDTGESVLVLNF